MSKRANQPRVNDQLWWLPCAIAGAAIICFWPALQNGFVYDDQKLLETNFNFRGLGTQQLAWMFSAPRFGQYHPLTWISFAADFLLFGMNPHGFHAINLLLHAANAVLFFFIARFLLDKALADGSPRTREAVCWGAAFAALVFAVHPLRVESVAWVTERRGLLSGFFLMLALLLYLKDRRRSSLGFYLLSLLSKATGVVLPVVLVLLDFYPLRRSGRRIWLEKIPYVVLALPFALIAPVAQSREGALQSFSNYGLFPRIGQAAFGSIFYLWKTLFPVRLTPFIRFPDQVNPFENGQIFLCMAVFIAISAAVMVLYRKRSAWAVLWGCYLALLAPVMGFFQSGPHFAADRYTYLPCLSWALLAGAGLTLWLKRQNIIPLVAAGVYLTCLGTLSWGQTLVWRSPETLWAYAVSLDPRSYLAQNNLCTALHDQGNAAALEHCQAALTLRPDYEQGHTNLGNLLLDDGEVEDAIVEFKEALRLKPDDPTAHYDLGVAYDKEGRVDQAIQEYQASLRIKPDDPQALNNLGTALSSQARFDDAASQFEQALALEPDNAKAHFNLGNLFYQQQRFDEAARQFGIALKLRPEDPRTHVNLGLCLNALGRPKEAAEQFHAAIVLKPDFAEAFNNLGIALFQQGQYQDAVESFQSALKIKPDYADARFNLDRARMIMSKR